MGGIEISRATFARVIGILLVVTLVVSAIFLARTRGRLKTAATPSVLPDRFEVLSVSKDWNLLSLNSEQCTSPQLKLAQFFSAGPVWFRDRSGNAPWRDLTSATELASSASRLDNSFWYLAQADGALKLSQAIPYAASTPKVCHTHASLFSKQGLTEYLKGLDDGAERAKQLTAAPATGVQFFGNPFTQPIPLTSLEAWVVDRKPLSSATLADHLKSNPDPTTLPLLKQSYGELLKEKYLRTSLHRFDRANQRWQKLTPDDSIAVNEAVAYRLRGWPVLWAYPLSLLQPIGQPTPEATASPSPSPSPSIPPLPSPTPTPTQPTLSLTVTPNPLILGGGRYGSFAFRACLSNIPTGESRVISVNIDLAGLANLRPYVLMPTQTSYQLFVSLASPCAQVDALFEAGGAYRPVGEYPIPVVASALNQLQSATARLIISR